MTYVPDPNRYDAHALPPLRAQRPAAARDLARPLAQLRRRPTRSRPSARSCAAPSTSASPTSTSPTTTARRYGSAEDNFGRILATDLAPYRDELIISTKAGYDMWPGPYGDWGSRKYLLASLDQSLRADGPRLRRHLLLATAPTPRRRSRRRWARSTRPCARARRSTSASRPTPPSRRARRRAILRDARARRCSSTSPRYSMLNRWIEDGLLDVLGERGRRLHRLLAARAGPAHRPLPRRHPGRTRGPRRARPPAPRPAHRRDLADGSARSTRSPRGRGQTLAQMALAWVLRDPRVTSALIGASRASRSSRRTSPRSTGSTSPDELAAIDAALAGL